MSYFLIWHKIEVILFAVWAWQSLSYQATLICHVEEMDGIYWDRDIYQMNFSGVSLHFYTRVCRWFWKFICNEEVHVDVQDWNKLLNCLKWCLPAAGEQVKSSCVKDSNYHIFGDAGWVKISRLFQLWCRYNAGSYMLSLQTRGLVITPGLSYLAQIFSQKFTVCRYLGCISSQKASSAVWQMAANNIKSDLCLQNRYDCQIESGKKHHI